MAQNKKSRSSSRKTDKARKVSFSSAKKSNITCRNGQNCRFLKKGKCWFSHESPHQKTNKKDKKETRQPTIDVKSLLNRVKSLEDRLAAAETQQT